MAKPVQKVGVNHLQTHDYIGGVPLIVVIGSISKGSQSVQWALYRISPEQVILAKTPRSTRLVVKVQKSPLSNPQGQYSGVFRA